MERIFVFTPDSPDCFSKRELTMTALYSSAGRNEKNGQSQFFGGGKMTVDKTLLSRSRSIGGLFLLVKGYLASKSRGWRCGWERKVEQRPLF